MDKKFESVDYLERKKVYTCTFKDNKKFFLKRSDIIDDVDSKVTGIVVHKSGSHFTIKYASGEQSDIPWDFVKSLCDEKYEYYKRI